MSHGSLPINDEPASLLIRIGLNQDSEFMAMPIEQLLTMRYASGLDIATGNMGFECVGVEDIWPAGSDTSWRVLTMKGEE